MNRFKDFLFGFFVCVISILILSPKLVTKVQYEEVQVPLMQKVEVPVPVVETQEVIEYVYVKDESKYIDPSKVPVQSKPWVYYGNEGTMYHLINDHEVDGRMVKGWSDIQLKNLHAYLHNGNQINELYK